MGPNRCVPTPEGLGYLALVKCTRLLRLGRLMKKLDQLQSANAFRAVKMVLVFILVAHWGACGWYVAHTIHKFP